MLSDWAIYCAILGAFQIFDITMENPVRYTNQEYADMHLIYGETRYVPIRGGVAYNARQAARIYMERFPNRRHPDREVFTRTHNAYSTGRIPGRDYVERTGRPQTADDDFVLNVVTEEPGTSTRIIQSRTGIPRSTNHRILKRYGYHPYHIQRIQTLEPRDYAVRRRFCRIMIRKIQQDPNFFDSVLWSDESACRRDGYLNLHNVHSWQIENPHECREDRSQVQFKINLWAGIFNGQVLGPVELPSTLNGQSYLNFLQNDLPALLEDTPLELRRRMWLQNDGCPAHYAIQVRQYLNEAFPGRWIGRLGPILWPARSPDLNPLDFFYWGCLKDKIYDKPIRNREELVEKVRAAAQTISQLNLRCLKRSFLRRCRLCLRQNGRQFEHLL